MSYKIYILFSDIYRKTYVGFSENPLERMEKHNSGQVASTKKFRPWRIVYEESVENYEEVRNRERYYKSGAGRRKIKAIFDDLGINK